MRYFWYLPAFFCAIVYFTVMFFENLPALVHNIFYKTKRPVYWNPLKEARRTDVELDEYERMLS